MKAGRELDALIAEKIFQYDLRVDGAECYLDDEGKWRAKDSRKLLYYANREPGQMLPNYSTSIAAAWEVVKKMDPLRLTLRQRMVRGEEWTADFSSAVSRRGFGEGLTAAEAICLAALKTCEVEVPA